MLQVKRVQKYVETLDMLKIKNSMPSTDENQVRAQQQPRQPDVPRASTLQQQQNLQYTQQQPQQAQKHSTSGTIVTTKWETFDSTPSATPFSTPAPISVTNSSVNSNFHWDLI